MAWQKVINFTQKQNAEKIPCVWNQVNRSRDTHILVLRYWFPEKEKKL